MNSAPLFSRLAWFGLAVIATVCPLKASISVAELTSGTLHNADEAAFGQSFLTDAGGPWNHITFNFFSDPQGTVVPYAIGTAFLFSQELNFEPYLPGPVYTRETLSSDIPGFVGESVSVSDGKWVFPSDMVLQAGTMYWFYETTVLTPRTLIGGDVAYCCDSYFSFPDAYYRDGFGQSANFLVTGILAAPLQAVPEPAMAGLFGVGLLFALGFGLAQRRYAKVPSRAVAKTERKA